MLRSALFLFLSLTFAACGFRPVHAPVSAQQHRPDAILQTISVEPIPTRSGQILQVELEDLLHPANQFPQPRYQLRIILEERKQPIVIEQNARVSRFNLLMVAKYSLVDLISGATIHQAEAKRIGSYNASLSDFSTYVAEGDARGRTLKQLAQDIFMRLSAYLKSK